MAGLFSLFGGRTKYVDEPTTNSEQTNGNGQKGSFFLEPDDAKTLGNIDYMRTPITIKRSFPKTLKGEGGEVVQQVSAMEKAKVNENGQISANSSVVSEVKPISETPTRRTSDNSDNSLDLFRKMAKEIKK
jgi:hypothetical protein